MPLPSPHRYKRISSGHPRVIGLMCTLRFCSQRAAGRNSGQRYGVYLAHTKSSAPVSEPFVRRQVPYFRHGLGDEEILAVCKTLRSDWLTAGPQVKQFEADFAALVGAPFTIATASATAALHVALE